jgi:hypothetical protein
MGKYLILLVPALCLARPADEAGFRRALFAVLRDELSGQEPIYSQDLLARLHRETGVDEQDLRARLLGLLEELEQQRREKTDPWKALMLQGGTDVPAETAGKLLGQLVGESRAMLQGEGNFLLESSLKKAARKSRLSLFQSRDYLLRALDWALAGEEEGEGKRAFGLLVSGHINRFEVSLDPLFLFFNTQDEALVREQVREVQRFIVPALVRRLGQSPWVKWAVRQRDSNALLVPDYHLVFGVENLLFAGSNLDLRPCLEARIELFGFSPEVKVAEEAFTFCTEENGSATTRELAPFWEEVAGETSRRLEKYLVR